MSHTINHITLNTMSNIQTPKTWGKTQPKRLRFISRIVLFTLLLTLPLWAFAKTLDVSTDRQTVEIGDIITLTVRADFQTRNSQLNLDSLKDQFEILGRQQSNQIAIINGNFSSSTLWKITLLPKQEGELIVPPLQVEGVQSTPYKIKVRPAPKKSMAVMGNYFLESNLNKQQAYVQEEVIYRLRFYFLGTFQGNIRPPVFENSLTTTLKDQAMYGKNINGKNYTVYEWLYAFYPQKSGKFTIKGPVFSGIQQYQNRQKGVQEIAKTQTLTVLPEPVQNKANTYWLPAKSLTLSETWDSQKNTIRVGDSLTRTLTLTVTGLRTSQLPELKTENQSSFKVYNDQPITEERALDNGIRSTQQTKQTIIFTQEGQVTLPEQPLEWFNTQTQSMETATIKARRFTVLPALNNAQSSTPTSSTTTPMPTPSTTADLNHTNSNTQPNVSRETSFIWPLITSLLGFAWFITLVLWRRETKKLKTQLQQLAVNTSLETQQPLAQSTLTLCDGNEMPAASEFYSQLKIQLKTHNSIKSFNALENSELKQAIYQLEAHLFSNAKLPDNTLKNICTHLEEMAKNSPPPSQKQAKKGKQLASLYKH